MVQMAGLLKTISYFFANFKSSTHEMTRDCVYTSCHVALIRSEANPTERVTDWTFSTRQYSIDLALIINNQLLINQ